VCDSRLLVETPAAVCCVMAVVPRAECVTVRGLAELRRLLLQAAELYDNPQLGVTVVAVAEHSQVQRLPSAARVLPPAEWGTAKLDAGKVFIAISLWQ